MRRWAWGSARSLSPGWAVAPPGLARLCRYPARIADVGVRVGLDEAPLRSPEGAALFAAGRLTLRPDPGRASDLARHFPSGWDDGSEAALAEGLRADLERTAASTPFLELMSRPGGAGALPKGTAEALARMGMTVDGTVSTLVFYPAGAQAARGESRARAPSGRRVLLVGLDGADWDLIDPLLQQGRLPNLARLVSTGVRARLKTISPVLSPLIWTSIATGVEPERHGIVDFFATSSTTGAQIPVTSNMRKVKALWNILSERGIPSGVVAWWATWPAEPVAGFMVSDRVAYQLFGVPQQEGLSRRAYPEALSLLMRPLVASPESIDEREVRRFIDPQAPGVSGMADHVSRLRQNLSSARTYLHIGMDFLHAYDPDLKAIYFEGTDTIAHSFMRYRPPAMAGVSDAETAALGSVVDRYYEYQDELLGRVLSLADERTVIVVCSDHGFRTGSNRPSSDPRIEMGGAADWHRKFGILIASGPGVRRGVTLDDASILDITPTLLAVLGLPVAQDMAGHVIAAMFESAVPVQTIASYESGGERSGSEPIASALDEEIRARLTALGYVGQEGTNAMNNVGVTLLDKGRFGEAADAFRSALKKEPGFQTARINLGRALMLMKDYDRAVETLEAVLKAEPDEREVYTLLGNIHMEKGDLARAERRFRQVLELDANDTTARNSLGLLYDRMGKDDRAIAEYEKVIAVDPDYAEGYNNIGLVHRKKGDPRRAIELFDRAIQADPDFSGSYNNKGLAHQDLGQFAEARRAFERGLQMDPDNAVMLNNLGTLDLAENQLEAARARFEQSMKADPEYPSAHNNLGAVLGMLGREAEAFEHYKKAVELDPRYTDAQFNLARSHLVRSHPDEAIRMLESLVKVDPGYGKAWLQLGMLEAQQGNLKSALSHAQEAVRVMPSSFDAHNLLADIYVREGRKEDARRELEASLKLNANQPRVRDVLARLTQETRAPKP
ncbi:MAG: tetratricopeptide repeat protein [Candidatus Polarisedimenticolia bacterium]